MKIHKVAQRTTEWFALRSGRITGTKLKNLVTRPAAWRRPKGSSRKIEFYQLLADKLGVTEDEGADEEAAMHRGSRLEESARARFEKETGKTVTEAGFCTHSKNPDLAFSPDGLIENDGKYNEDVEIKCLGAAKHLQAYVEQYIQQEFEAQNMQAFIVNEDLERRHFVYYNPDVEKVQYHCIVVERGDILDKVAFYQEAEERVLAEVEGFVRLIQKL